MVASFAQQYLARDERLACFREARLRQEQVALRSEYSPLEVAIADGPGEHKRTFAVREPLGNAAFVAQQSGEIN
ncbi:MAG: hypothetical protein KAX84_11475 [Burkholderiales bacterium]|nr:hypothetical protein [Burkholderiales bacterium]